MGTIDRKTVEQVARLSKISLSEEQLDASAAQLLRIVEFVGQLEAVELPDDIEPFFGAIESENPIREDQRIDSLDRSQIMSNAPDTDGEFYRVPPVFDQG